MKYKKEIVKTLNENFNFPVEFEKMTFKEIGSYLSDIIRGKNTYMTLAEFEKHPSCQRLIILSLRGNPDKVYKTYECVPCKKRGIKSIVEYHGQWTNCQKCEQYWEYQWETHNPQNYLHLLQDKYYIHQKMMEHKAERIKKCTL